MEEGERGESNSKLNNVLVKLTLQEITQLWVEFLNTHNLFRSGIAGTKPILPDNSGLLPRDSSTTKKTYPVNRPCGLAHHVAFRQFNLRTDITFLLN